MTPAELDAALHNIRWTPDILARALECEVCLVHAWLEGNAEVPTQTGAWISILAETHEAFEKIKPVMAKSNGYQE